MFRNATWAKQVNIFNERKIALIKSQIISKGQFSKAILSQKQEDKHKKKQSKRKRKN